MKILLIEDDQILVRMYKTFLQNHGYDVDLASDGQEGLTKALQEHPDLILLDLRMPVMDGMTLLKRLRHDEWGQNAKVIILTNLPATDNILQEIINNRPTYYLVKSDNKPEKVLEHIEEVLEKKQSQDHA